MLGLSPTFCTRAQLRAYLRGRKQALKDARNARSYSLHCAALDASYVLYERICVEVRAGARHRRT